MKNKPLFLFLLLSVLVCPFVFPSPLYSPAWGFRVDFPEDYAYTGGGGKDRFSFENPDGAKIDLAVYYAAPGKSAPYPSLEALAVDVRRRLNSGGDLDRFLYRGKEAFIMELSFSLPGAGGRQVPQSGWALCLGLAPLAAASGAPGSAGTAAAGPAPMLLAMAYGPAGRDSLHALHFSALDSVSPEEGDRSAPGPVTEFAYPRETRVQVPLSGLDVSAWIYREDAEAAQAVVDREFQVLRRHVDSPDWKAAWQRFYRAVYKDSYDRLADAAFQIERNAFLERLEAAPPDGQGGGGPAASPDRGFAEQALAWVQGFRYERDFMGSDFVNLVSAAVEGRGDCDSRAMLWALVMNHADIPSALMVSRHYSHAMGLAELPGAGARFETEGRSFLVAETTASVRLGLIGETVSAAEYWLGVTFD